MAERRMFAKTIIDSDAFLDMPISARLLYYDLAMRADDDGFINSPKKIMRIVGASDDDLKVLATKKFIIPFESGIVVIKHWKIHNYISKDRYTETKYKDEKALLQLDENNSYTTCIQPVYKPSTQDRLGKDRLGKDRLDNNIPASEVETSPADTAKANEKDAMPKHKYGEYKHVLLKDEELQKLKDKYDNWEELIKYLDEYIEMKGYKAKSHYLCITKWVIKAVEDEQRKEKQKENTVWRKKENQEWREEWLKQNG